MGNVACHKTATGLDCTFEQLLTQDRHILEFKLMSRDGKEIKDKAELERALKQIENGSLVIAGNDENGRLVNAQEVDSAYEVVYKLTENGGKARFLVQNSGQIKFQKSISVQDFTNERTMASVRAVARILDLPPHRGVLQPEAVYFDGDTLNFVLTKADADLKDTAARVRRSSAPGPLLAFLTLQLLKAVEHIHANDKVLGGDLDPRSVLVFKTNGIPELKIVPGKHTVPQMTQQQEDALQRFTQQQIKLRPQSQRPQYVRDLDIVDCGFVAPELAVDDAKEMPATKASDMFAVGSLICYLITGKPFACGCEDFQFTTKLIELEHLPIEGVSAREFWTQFVRVFGPFGEDKFAPFDNLGAFADPLIRLMRKMVVLNPDKRYSAAEAVMDPVFDLKPHELSSFSTINEMLKFVSDYVKMPPEARAAILRKAQEDESKDESEEVKQFKQSIGFMRERFAMFLANLMQQQMPGQNSVQVVADAVRLTDRFGSFAAPTEYVHNLMAMMALSLNIGTAYPLPVQQRLMELVLQSSAKDFGINVDKTMIESLQQQLLARHSAAVFVEQQASQKQVLSLDDLAAMVREPVPSQQWAKELEKYKDRTGVVAEGAYAQERGRIIRVMGEGSNKTVLLELNSGERVALPLGRVFLDER